MIKIQKLTKEYIDAVAALLRSEWLLHADATRSYSRKLIEERSIPDWLEKRVLLDKDFSCFVAIEGSSAAGFILYRVCDAISIAPQPRYIKIEDVYITEDHRGKGLARSLLAKVEETATELGIKEVLGDVYAFNEASKNLFSSSGYTPEYTNYMKVLGAQKAKAIIEKSQVGDLEHAKLYADGGSRGNPGPSAGGYAILNMENNVVKSNGKYLGITTNNQAEYHSLKGGIEMALELGVKRLDVYMDSMLVVNQMKGIFKIKNRDLWPIHDAIKQMLPNFQKVTFTHIPRELNTLADKVVNDTLDRSIK
jgi:ribonuclease HI/L-amino acid N-acyltransferase YncA